MTYLKTRNIIAVVLLSIFTCGIYSIILLVSLTDEIRREATSEKVSTITMSGGSAFMLSIITCGIFLFFHIYNLSKSLEEIGRKNNVSIMEPALITIFYFFFGLGFIISAYYASQIAEVKMINGNNN